MSYLKYANICADLLRAVMKEPHKSKAAARSSIYFRAASWAEGKQGKAGGRRLLGARLRPPAPQARCRQRRGRAITAGPLPPRLALSRAPLPAAVITDIKDVASAAK
jgi:hypothetical protein